MSSSALNIVIEKTNPVCSSSLDFAPFHMTTYQESKNMSSASSVCQGLQSCLEHLLLEPHILMHQLAPSNQALSLLSTPQKEAELPRAECSKHCAIGKNYASNRIGGEPTSHWASIQSLTNHRKPAGEAEQNYVHPLVRRSSSSLSTRSLEMCTESLGSETGSNIIDSGTDEFSHEKQRSCRGKMPKPGESCKTAKQSGGGFPPPLTSISGSDGVQVQTHREGGRLVIKAFTFSLGSPCFQVERKNGRLRLSLLKDEYLDTDPELGNENEEGISAEEENAEESGDEDEISGGFWEGKDGGKMGCKISGKEWPSSSSRCNGDRSGSNRLPGLPFCMAIS